MDDLISRQAAIDAAIEAVDSWDGGCNIGRQKRIENYINSLPPALGTNLAEVGTDAISRQQAIDALWKALFEYEEETEKQFQKRDDLDVGDWIGEYREFVQNMSDIDRRVILNMPPAEPKGGKWILDRSGAYCCSECMEPCATYVMMRPRDKYCKMCGAKMEVTE